MTINSNFTGLRLAEEVLGAPKVLPGENDLAQGLTFVLRVSGAAAQAGAVDTYSYTAAADESIDDVGAALAALIVVDIGAGTTYTAGTNTLLIPGSETLGDATVEFWVYNGDYLLSGMDATITDDQTDADDLTIVLPVLSAENAAVFYEYEPNSYGDFGGQVTTVARAPITAGRQRKKGRPTDLDAAAAFQLDFTQNNLNRVLPAFFFANWRKAATAEYRDPSLQAVAADDDFDGVGIDDVFATGDIILASGFLEAANNGLFYVTGEGAGTLQVNALATAAAPALVNEVAPAGASLKRVGYRGAAGVLEISVAGSLPALVSDSGPNFTTWGLVPGQWVYIGGDEADTSFAAAGNNGFARIAAISATQITFDKTQNTMSASGALMTETIAIFFPDMIRNEPNPADIVIRTFQAERSLSTAGYQYEKGCFANTLTMNFAQADKLNVDLAWVAMDDEPRETRKAGVFPAIDTDANFFNTSSDFARIRTIIIGETTPLFAFLSEMTLTINNNVTPAKALAVFGAFDANIGDFVGQGSITAYFSDVAALTAIRESEDVTFDFALVKDNAGWVWDIPLVALGEGRLAVEKDQKVTIPVSADGAEHPTLHTTLQAMHFAYLPDAAG
jgi:hypothetical protein